MSSKTTGISPRNPKKPLTSDYAMENQGVYQNRTNNNLHTYYFIIINKLTKMNRGLPLLLFYPLPFIKLFESHNYSAISYWFPAICFIIAMSNKEVLFQWQRINALYGFCFFTKNQKLNRNQ